jgi:TM2 domain-containing membrane protein YozV
MEESLMPTLGGGPLRRNGDTITVEKNRKRAFWSLIIVLFFVPISGLLVFLGLQPGRGEISGTLVLFGLLGLLVFAGSALVVIRTMRAPWRLEISPSYLSLFAPTYDLQIPWEQVAAIAVDEFNRRLACVLVFEDLPALVAGARFRRRTNQRDAVTNQATMQARLEDNFQNLGYHLAIPGRILELGPQELAGVLVQARTGVLWRQEAE